MLRRSFFVTRALIKIPCNNYLVLKVNDASEIQVLNEIDRLRVSKAFERYLFWKKSHEHPDKLAIVLNKLYTRK